MAKRFFLMKSQTYSSKKVDIQSLNDEYDWSVKYDGMRCFWDGGITRGKIAPWHTKHQSTGLWSMNGKPIFAPSEFLDKLPTDFFLDGELTAGPNMFQETMSICRKYEPNPEDWKKIEFLAFDIPSPSIIFKEGSISSASCNIKFDNSLIKTLKEWVKLVGIDWDYKFPYSHSDLKNILKNTNVKPVNNVNPSNNIDDKLTQILTSGFEGLMFRKHDSIWTPERTWNLLKYKPVNDDEGKVIGFQYGRTGKLCGKMGALIVENNGKKIKMSGFTDEERTLTSKTIKNVEEYAKNNAGSVNINNEHDIQSVHFPIGTLVTYTYRELTDGGHPKDARFKRVRPEE